MAGVGGFGSANVGHERRQQGEAPVLRMVQPDVMHTWGNPGGFTCEYLKDGSMRLAGSQGITGIPAGAPALAQMVAEGMAANPQDVLLHNLGRSLGIQMQAQAPAHPSASAQTHTDPATGGQSLNPYTGPAFTAPPPGQVEIPMGPHQGPAAPSGGGAAAAAPEVRMPGALTVASSEASAMSPNTKLLLAALVAAAAVAGAVAAGAALYSYNHRRRAP